MELLISAYCKIANHKIWVNDTLTYEAEPSELGNFLNDVYRHLNIGYPKFFKMDNLCKLGVLATELAIKNSLSFEHHAKENIALLFSNRASSIDTDRNHVKSIADKNHYFPSPSVFVYTLPNIVIGEIAIKHKITGENAFFVSENFDIELILNYAQITLKNTSASCVLCAWVNVDGNNYEAFVFCVEKPTFKQEKKSFELPFSKASIQQIIS